MEGPSIAAKRRELAAIRSEWAAGAPFDGGPVRELRDGLRKFKQHRLKNSSLTPIPEVISAVHRLEAAVLQSLQREVAGAGAASLVHRSVVTMVDAFEAIAEAGARWAGEVARSVEQRLALEQGQRALEGRVQQQDRLIAQMLTRLDETEQAICEGEETFGEVAAVLQTIQREPVPESRMADQRMAALELEHRRLAARLAGAGRLVVPAWEHKPPHNSIAEQPSCTVDDAIEKALQAQAHRSEELSEALGTWSVKPAGASSCLQEPFRKKPGTVLRQIAARELWAQSGEPEYDPG